MTLRTAALNLVARVSGFASRVWIARIQFVEKGDEQPKSLDLSVFTGEIEKARQDWTAELQKRDWQSLERVAVAHGMFVFGDQQVCSVCCHLHSLIGPFLMAPFDFDCDRSGYAPNETSLITGLWGSIPEEKLETAMEHLKTRLDKQKQEFDYDAIEERIRLECAAIESWQSVPPIPTRPHTIEEVIAKGVLKCGLTVDQIEALTPPLTEGDGMWINTTKARQRLGISVDEFSDYRKKSRSPTAIQTQDRLFGANKKGHIWRKVQATNHPKWFSESVPESGQNSG